MNHLTKHDFMVITISAVAVAALDSLWYIFRFSWCDYANYLICRLFCLNAIGACVLLSCAFMTGRKWAAWLHLSCAAIVLAYGLCQGGHLELPYRIAAIFAPGGLSCILGWIGSGVIVSKIDGSVRRRNLTIALWMALLLLAIVAEAAFFLSPGNPCRSKIT